MRTLITLALVAAALPAFANGNSDSVKADVKVTIVAPVKITSDGALNFGKIVVNDITQDASVTIKTTTAPNGNTVPTIEGWNGCAAYKNSTAGLDAPQFHVSHDVQTVVNAKVLVSIEDTIILHGGKEGAKPCSLKTNNDLPAVDCNLTNIDGQSEIKDYVAFHHFGVGGTLSIPAGNLGEKTGKIGVTVSYI